MDLAIARTALALWEVGKRFALVSTLETSGSSPRHSGAAMIVEPDGSTTGTVGGGALEARAIRTASEAIAAGASRMMDFELTAADSAGLGMICGGRGRLLIEYLDPGAAGAAPADAGAGPKWLVELRDLLAAGARGWLVTQLTEPGDAAPMIVKRWLIDAGGRVAGEARPPEAGPGVYKQPVGIPGTAFVFGAGHCGKSLVPLLSMVGFQTVIVDDRAEFANAGQFPDADSIVVPDSFAGALDHLPVDESSYIVIMTRGHLFDRSVLAQALRTRAAYVGMIGSKKKISETFQALREQGFTDDDLARVHSPIGLSIGAETPEEIAVSIAAEIISVRHRSE